MSFDKSICEIKKIIISNPMHFILLSNLCIFNLTTTNINETNNQNFMIHDDGFFVYDDNESQMLNIIQCNITNTNNNRNSSKSDEEVKSNQCIDDSHLPFKKRKYITNFQNSKVEIFMNANRLLQTDSVPFSNIKDEKFLIVQELPNDHRLEESLKINVSDNENHKEINTVQIDPNLYSSNFKNVFKVLKNDLLNCLKYGRLYLFETNSTLNEVIFKLEKNLDFDDDITSFINTLVYFIKIDLNYKRSINDEKYNFILSLLYTANYKNAEELKIYHKISTKIELLNRHIQKNNIDYKDVFDATFVLIEIIHDDKFFQLFIIALQNIFIKNRNGTIPKFVDILVFLYHYKYKRKDFNLDWLDYFFKLLSVQTQSYKNLSYFNKIKKWIFKVDENLVFYRKYIIMNSYSIKNSMNFYDGLSRNQSELNLIHYLIYKLNKVKSKIYKIKDI